MQKNYRVSVRELVAFTYFQPDILPSADAEALVNGTLAHQARQMQSEGKVEQTIKHTFDAFGANVTVYGRMDAFLDGEIPFVDEIKHAYTPPETVRDEHRAQALCYAAMIAETMPCDHVRFAVSYVNMQGELLRAFEEEMDRQSLGQFMLDLLRPYVAFAMREEQHCQLRNISLKRMQFPFDQYRKGQRELAAQVYTAISRKKRLFASLPTGTGKSAAVLFPALKAIGEEKTERIVYLTARNTARQSPLNAIARMHEQGMHARCCVLTSKEKMCSALLRCHPDTCSRAKGHFLRQGDAIDELVSSDTLLWDEACINKLADKHHICAFELNLALCEIADVVIMDLNHAFDPFAQVKRLFQKQKRFTLLVDEAHHTLDRVRDNLSGMLDGAELAKQRTIYGKVYGKKTGVYRALTALIHALRQLKCAVNGEKIEKLPEEIQQKTQALLDECMIALGSGEAGLQEIVRMCMSFLYACGHLDEDYAILLEPRGKERVLQLYCLLPGKEISRITKGLRGTIFFSATLSPLQAMKQLLGGDEDDACFSLPSPFPPERLKVLRRRIDTRFERREETAAQIAEEILALLNARPAKTIVYFPSYAYMKLIIEHLQNDELPRMWIQEREMDEEAREAFLKAFTSDNDPLLGMCVLGGLFSEGIDLPGKQLENVVIVGTGLPVPSLRINTLREYYQQTFGDGFFYACRIPGIQKVLQAAGRVIRSETDKGIVMLLDERYGRSEYVNMLPEEWVLSDGTIQNAAVKLEEI